MCAKSGRKTESPPSATLLTVASKTPLVSSKNAPPTLMTSCKKTKEAETMIGLALKSLKCNQVRISFVHMASSLPRAPFKSHPLKSKKMAPKLTTFSKLSLNRGE